jgi:hemerythrin
MRLFKWTNAYAVYIPEIDAEHRTLYQMADDLHRTILAGTDTNQILASLRELLAHVAHHFAHEERLMLSVDDPALAWHKRQHDLARKNLKSFERRVRGGEREAALLLLEYLSDWMKIHLKFSDILMGSFLRNHARVHAIAS